jgi:hypothetical protein
VVSSVGDRVMDLRKYIKENDMRLSKGIYELVPYLYAFAGVAATIDFRKVIGVVSGFLLILIAGMIFLMRRNYREEAANHIR